MAKRTRGGQVSQSPRRAKKDSVAVLIITPDHITGEVLKNALSRGQRDFVVGTLSGNSREIIGELAARRPHVALICEELQDGPQAGFKVLQSLRRSHPDTAAIILSCSNTNCHLRQECVVAAFREGARGIFHRTDSLKALSKCIRTVHEGQFWANNKDLGFLINALSNHKPLQFNNASGMPLLTRREEDVVRLVADGLKNREIAEKLKVKDHTIRNYLYRIFEKLGVSTRIELVLYAFSHHDRSNN
jgi:DNA-binding NarL/FixJ family response regulator